MVLPKLPELSVFPNTFVPPLLWRSPSSFRSDRSPARRFSCCRSAAIKSIVYVRAPTRVAMRVKQRDRCDGAVNTSCCRCCSAREKSRRIMMTKCYDDGAFVIGDRNVRCEQSPGCTSDSECPLSSDHPSIIVDFR